MKNYFYSHVFHTTTMLFASIFDEMEVWDYDAEGHAVGRIPVPVKLTYKEKVLSALLNNNTQNPYVTRDNENVLPMISLQLRSAALDKERMKGVREKRHIYLEYVDPVGAPRPLQKQHMDMQTIPYKLTFDVILWAKYIDHIVQLAENIDTFIHPEMYLEYYEKGIGIGRKIKVVKTGETMNFSPDLPENELRQKFITWSYTFEVECNLYKPELPVGEPIKRVVVRNSSLNGNTGVTLGEQTVSQTVDALSTETTAGSACFYDYDADIVNYIRKFSDDEHSQIASQYEPFLDCQTSPQNIMPPAVTDVPPLAFGEVALTATTDLVTVTSTLLADAPEYVPRANINAKNMVPNFTIVGFENIQPGSFQIRLSAIPSDDSFSIVWNAYQKYNSDPDDV